jgi:uncharacterized protein
MRGISRDVVVRSTLAGDLDTLKQIAASEGIAAILLDQDPQELTTLHLACAAGHAGVVQYLLSAEVGADPRAARINNFTPLHSAAMKGHTAICEVLLRSGAEVNVQTNPQGYSPLHSAAFAGHLEAIQVLVAHGADAGLINYRNERPIDTARRQGQLKVVEFMETGKV